MLNYRVQIFYITIITVIVSVGNVITFIKVLHPNNFSDQTTEGNNALDAIITNNQDWLYYVCNSFSIMSSLPLLFVITPNIERNSRRRLLLLPYAVWSITTIFIHQFIISKAITRQIHSPQDQVHAKISSHNNSTALKNDNDIAMIFNSQMNITNDYETISNGRKNWTISKNNNYSIILNNHERISFLVIYQVWLVARMIFFFLVCRYFYFLQYFVKTKSRQPKRSNATRRGIIGIRINGKADAETVFFTSNVCVNFH